MAEWCGSEIPGFSVDSVSSRLPGGHGLPLECRLIVQIVYQDPATERKISHYQCGPWRDSSCSLATR